MTPRLPSRPCLALPFTVLTGPDRVRLIAGEDFRYTLAAPGLETWLPDVLARLDGSHTLDELLLPLDAEHQAAARQLVTQLYGERVLIDGSAPAAHRPGVRGLRLEGSGPLRVGLETATAAEPCVSVLCQDRLDYDEALRFNERALQGNEPWLWLSIGALNRGYVSPVFLPDAGPCLACLLTHFEKLSSAPELYADLRDHAQQGRPIRPVQFPSHGIAILQNLLRWKVELLAEPDAPAALFQLHALEVATLEVTAHRVFADPECPACFGKR